MNILNAFVLFAILLKCVTASGDDMGVRFKEAVDGENFEWLEENLIAGRSVMIYSTM